jgi:NAD(P)-dependent dehydrogenase (short-subunit alcohol dehydrogenase family)
MSAAAEPRRRRYALVTGAAAGIGRAAALRLAQEQTAVALLDVRPHELARAMAGELASIGIRVNIIVVPGFIDTRMNAHVVADANLMTEAEELIPLRRIGQPSEVAGIIAWLTSADAGYATGGYYPVDGGQMCL